MQNNKLIAEFMKLPTEVFKSGELNYYFREFNSGSWYKEHELSYNVSWDWLMPVVEKMNTTELWDEYDISHLATYLVSVDINATYKEVVEFIKQYNDATANNTKH